MDIAAGNLYDANKELMLKNEKPLNHLELVKKQELIEDFFTNDIVQYAMLLCHEQRDYTIFNLKSSSTAAFNAAKELFYCLNNRGKILSIDKTEDGVAYEIWLKIDDEAFCYYLFPYDKAVIECD